MTCSSHQSSTDDALSTEDLIEAQVDGPVDLASPDTPKRRRLAGDVCAIFVHAGAGFHSLQNEKVHLAACEEYVYPVE